MTILVCDIESYYSKTFSLSKLTTEEYIRSKSFEVIGVAVQSDGNDPVWYSGTKANTKKFLDQFDWANATAVAHNAAFDMAILNWHFDIRPKRIIDTLSIARAVHGTNVGGSLAALVQHYNLGAKGTEVNDALGKRRLDFNIDELARYGMYCKNDVVLTYKLLNKLMVDFPAVELGLIDLTVRMFTEPKLELDVEVLTSHLHEVTQAKEELLAKITDSKEDIMSNPKLAVVLERLGVAPPMKTSLRTGKQAYAFAKSDQGFKALLEHENPTVQAVVAARLGVKSTLEESRTQRFIDIAGRGTLPIPLKYYAAHTGRWGGDDKINMQNLPRNSLLKQAIRAPDGYMLVDSDSSQIEARTLAWLAEQHDLVEAFERGEDVYKQMASKIYGKPEQDITKDERFVGKTTILGCISEGTPVLCDSGWKPIEQVTTNDKLWDGEEWVCHQGLLDKGWKETLSLLGVWLTPDHKVLCGTRWLEAQSVVADESILCQALVTGLEKLPLPGISQGYVKVYEQLLLSVGAEAPNILLTTVTSDYSKAPDATSALKSLARKPENCIGVIAKYSRMMHIVRDYLTAFQVALLDATQKLARHFPVTEVEVLLSTHRGAQIEQRSYDTLFRWVGGRKLTSTSTESTTAEGTNRVTYVLQPVPRTQGTNEKLASCRRSLRTYDLAYAGPRNRFTIATNAGPIIVHNCGYGMGADKFKAQLKVFGVETELDECQRIINVYRETYPKIVELWRHAGDALRAIRGNQATNTLGIEGALVVTGKDGIGLPNGLYLRYPNLRMEDRKGEAFGLVYDTKRGRTVVPTRIYGGKVIENVCQALARIIIGEQMLMVNKRYPVVMTVHDAIGALVPEAEVVEGQQYIEECMRTRPSWALGLPLNCESGAGKTYGDC